MKLHTAGLLFAVLCAPLSAQEFPNPKPTAAHKILAAEAGTWDTDVKMYHQGPNRPADEYKGVETNRLVSGGMYTLTTFKCKMGDKEFEGHGLFGYDSRSDEYVGTWVDNFTTIPTQMKGKYHAGRKTLTMFSKVVDPMSGQELKQKQVTTFVDDKTKTFEIFLLVEIEGKEQTVKIFEMTGKKRM